MYNLYSTWNTRKEDTRTMTTFSRKQESFLLYCTQTVFSHEARVDSSTKRDTEKPLSSLLTTILKGQQGIVYSECNMQTSLHGQKSSIYHCDILKRFCMLFGNRPIRQTKLKCILQVLPCLSTNCQTLTVSIITKPGQMQQGEMRGGMPIYEGLCYSKLYP